MPRWSLARARLGLGGGGAPDPTFDAYWKHAVEPSMQGLAEKTAHDYARTWRVELSPRIGSSKVSSLTWRRAEAVLRDVRSTSVQRHAMRLLRKVCNMAVRDGIIDRNPVDRSIGLDPHSKREKTMLDASDVDGFLESVRGIKYEPAILMELGGGMSHEEACAMAWDNVEAASRGGRAYALCRVEAALVTVGGRKVLKGTKNAFRERTCVVGEPFASRLLEPVVRKRARLPLVARPMRAERRRRRLFRIRLRIPRHDDAQLEAMVRKARRGIRAIRRHALGVRNVARRGRKPRFARLHGHGAFGRDHARGQLPAEHAARHDAHRRLPRRLPRKRVKGW